MKTQENVKSLQLPAIELTRRLTPEKIDSKALEAALIKYFNQADSDKEPYSVHKLAYSMGMTFEELKDFSLIIQSPYNRELQKRALALCEADASVRLLEGKPPIGLIFYLKNAFNWKDKREEERTFNIKVERVKYSHAKGEARKIIKQIKEI